MTESFRAFDVPTMSETVSGKFIDLADLKASDLDVHDIAWSLSRQARYAGHTMSRIPYTVAQHTVMVSRYVEEALTEGTPLNGTFHNYINEQLRKHACNDDEFKKWAVYQETLAHLSESLIKAYAFHGLMHDFAEGYYIDLPTPVKKLPGIYDAYKKYELKADALIYQTFGLMYSPTRFPAMWQFALMVVGWADMYALQVESYHLMPSRGLNWGIPLERPSLQQIYGFRWPVQNEVAYEELIARFEELRPKPWQD